MYSVAFFPIHNPSDKPILLLHSTRFGSFTLRPDLGISQDDFTFVSPAGSDWEEVMDRISALAVGQAGESRGEWEIGTGQSKDWEGVAEDGEENVSLRSADANEGRAPFEGLRSFTLPMKVERHRDYYDLPFKEGGHARSLQDLESLGLDLSQSYDTGHKNQRNSLWRMVHYSQSLMCVWNAHPSGHAMPRHRAL
eukprot:6188531-Pleurochrysis_carterae.AAC.1